MNEGIVYDIKSIMGVDKNILERAMCLNDFCKNLEKEKEKKKYLNFFFNSINTYFGSMCVSSLFNDSEEESKYTIFTKEEAEIAYFFIKCVDNKRTERINFILKNMQLLAQNTLERFEYIKNDDIPIKNGIIEILNFLEKKYNFHQKIFKNQHITLSLLNYKDKFAEEEEEFNHKIISYEIPRYYFLFYENNIKKALLNKISYIICLDLFNKTRHIPDILKEKLKSLDFKDFDTYSFEKQFSTLKEALTIGFSYDIPLEDDIPLDIKREYNSLLLSVSNIL